MDKLGRLARYGQALC